MSPTAWPEQWPRITREVTKRGVLASVRLGSQIVSHGNHHVWLAADWL